MGSNIEINSVDELEALGQAQAELKHLKTINRRLEERIKLQKKALDISKCSTSITDSEGVIIWVNKAFTQLTGYSFNEAA